MKSVTSQKRSTWLIVAALLVLGVIAVAVLSPSGSGSGASDDAILRPVDDTPSTDGGAGSGDHAATAPVTGGGGFSLGSGGAISLFWRLALVALILGVSVAGLRWWGKRTNGPRSVTGFIRVVDTLSISNGRSIHLVALGDRVVAIGATAQSLTLLDELRPEEAARVFAALPRPGEQPLATFAAELFQSMRTNAGRRTRDRHNAVIGEQNP